MTQTITIADTIYRLVPVREESDLKIVLWLTDDGGAIYLERTPHGDMRRP